MKNHRSGVWAGWLIAALVGSACTSSKDDGDGATGPRGSEETTSSAMSDDSDDDTATSGDDEPSTANGPGSIIDPIEPISGPGSETTDGGASPNACASTSANAELQELALAIAFDASGSMGEEDFPYHSKALKWDPVVTASRAFFESEDVARVSASLVFFPVKNSNRCDSSEYETPDVPLQSLPSTAFGEAIDAITPDRGGTPTLAVLRATIDYVEELRAAGSTAKHAIVLITDGMPQGCEDDDSMAGVVAAVQAVSEEIPVYVIGIANPITEEEPNPPDNVSNLHQIAEAGRTDQAFLIDTGNPKQTVSDFGEVIQSIRSQGLSCELDIPNPPSGMSFDEEKVNVSLTVGGEKTELVYSEDCSADSAWRYDDPRSPTTIVLCEQACEQTKTSTGAALQVEFGCERRIGSVK